MTGVDTQPSLGAGARRARDRGELPRRIGAGPRVGVGVDLESTDVAELPERANLRLDRVDEDRYRDACAREPGGGLLDAGAMDDQVEPALGGDLLRALRDERDLVGANRERDAQHLVGCRELEVELAANRGAQLLEVVILDVTAIRAQVHRDARGARRLGDARGIDRPREGCLSRLAKRRHVIDVDAERHRASSGGTVRQPRSPGRAAPRRKAASSCDNAWTWAASRASIMMRASGSVPL